jgi:excisionase family DNA binding protein
LQLGKTANVKTPQLAKPDSNEPLRAYSPKDFAAAINLHEETVRSALRSGRLPGIRIGSHWRITHSTLLTILRDGLPSPEH